MLARARGLKPIEHDACLVIDRTELPQAVKQLLRERASTRMSSEGPCCERGGQHGAPDAAGGRGQRRVRRARRGPNTYTYW